MSTLPLLGKKRISGFAQINTTLSRVLNISKDSFEILVKPNQRTYTVCSSIFSSCVDIFVNHRNLYSSIFSSCVGIFVNRHNLYINAFFYYEHIYISQFYWVIHSYKKLLDIPFQYNLFACLSLY